MDERPPRLRSSASAVADRTIAFSPGYGSDAVRLGLRSGGTSAPSRRRNGASRALSGVRACSCRSSAHRSASSKDRNVRTRSPPPAKNPCALNNASCFSARPAAATRKPRASANAASGAKQARHADASMVSTRWQSRTTTHAAASPSSPLAALLSSSNDVVSSGAWRSARLIRASSDAAVPHQTVPRNSRTTSRRRSARSLRTSRGARTDSDDRTTRFVDAAAICSETNVNAAAQQPKTSPAFSPTAWIAANVNHNAPYSDAEANLVRASHSHSLTRSTPTNVNVAAKKKSGSTERGSWRLSTTPSSAITTTTPTARLRHPERHVKMVCVKM
mmetsp:Transcript_4075/g.12303  ORF Transcript_4075/g.12303 Transcript_4075/m.12303 type:complete len:332 (-) Transcript_4075:533-1528(-)